MEQRNISFNEHLEINYLDDKLSVEWANDIIDLDFNVKITLVYTADISESIRRRYDLSAEFDEIFGVNNWRYYDNFGSRLDDIIFVKDINNLLTSMLISNVKIKEKFDKIEIYRPTK